MQPLDLDDYLAIAAEVLSVHGAAITYAANVPLAESALHAPFASFGGEEFYPDPVEKAAILCSRLVRNHPLPDGNKRAAFLSMRVFLEINGLPWRAPSEDERVYMVEGLAARTVSETEFVAWLRHYVE